MFLNMNRSLSRNLNLFDVLTNLEENFTIIFFKKSFLLVKLEKESIDFLLFFFYLILYI